MIVCFDPGITTGFAVVNEDIPELIESGQITNPQEEIPRILTEYEPAIVVYERYFAGRPFAKTGPAEVIGMIKMQCAYLKLQVVEQEPSVPTFIERRFLSYIEVGGLGGIHARDAFKHAIYYLHRKGIDVIPMLEALQK